MIKKKVTGQNGPRKIEDTINGINLKILNPDYEEILRGD